MKKSVGALFVLTMIGCAQTCFVDEAERDIGEVIKTVIDLRARQDPNFARFYDADEYSFPGEAWLFKGGERASERGRAIEAARADGRTWKMEIRELRIKAGCEMAWVTGLIHAERLDAERKATHIADWRLTAVLERRAAGWRIVHQHSSVPVTDARLWLKPVVADTARPRN